MKAIDFYADYAKWGGTVWYKSEETLRMPASWDKMLYCRLRSGSVKDVKKVERLYHIIIGSIIFVIMVYRAYRFTFLACGGISKG